MRTRSRGPLGTLMVRRALSMLQIGGAVVAWSTPADAQVIGPPPPPPVRYFAEGVTGDFFDTTFALLNPDAVDAQVVLTFVRTDGTTITAARTVPALSQVTIPVETIAGLERAEFSAIVVSAGGPVAVERTVTWAHGHGSHSDTGVASASRTWYLAEGATHSGFQLFYLVLNPGPAEATLRIEYLLPPPRRPHGRGRALARHRVVPGGGGHRPVLRPVRTDCEPERFAGGGDRALLPAR